MDENRIDDWMRDYAGLDCPGASVLVMRDGALRFRKAYGIADLENGIAATTATNYRLASVTKAFTAAAILRLEEQGRLSLDDAIGIGDISVRHLLTHSSGIIDYEDVTSPCSPWSIHHGEHGEHGAIPDRTGKPLLDADVLAIVQGHPMYFAPGTSYRYSNSGYALLALTVERVSGRSFSDFLRDEIFLPLGMRDTVAHREGVTTVARRAYGYSRAGTSWRRTDQNLTSAVLGDGGVYSSVDDLAHWLTALDRGAFAEAAIPRVATDEPGVHYGYGWKIRDDAVFHTGETIGFRNAVVRFPADRTAVVVLTNRNEGEPVELAFAIAAELVR